MKMLISAICLILYNVKIEARPVDCWFHYHTRSTTKIEDLEPAFQKNVIDFMTAFRTAGGKIEVFPLMGRTKERQYLMYWAWQIAKEGYRRTKHPEPPAYPGVDIDWFWSNAGPEFISYTADKYDVPSYVGGAIELVEKFEIVRNPGLSCKLVEGRAIMLDYFGSGKPLSVMGRDGKYYYIPYPVMYHDKNVIALPASYGLFRTADLDRHGDRTQEELDKYPISEYFTNDGKWN